MAEFKRIEFDVDVEDIDESDDDLSMDFGNSISLRNSEKDRSKSNMHEFINQFKD